MGPEARKLAVIDIMMAEKLLNKSVTQEFIVDKVLETYPTAVKREVEDILRSLSF